MTELNVWGTDKSLINADEYCLECEREVPHHYNNCPSKQKDQEMISYKDSSPQCDLRGGTTMKRWKCVGPKLTEPKIVSAENGIDALKQVPNATAAILLKRNVK